MQDLKFPEHDRLNDKNDGTISSSISWDADTNDRLKTMCKKLNMSRSKLCRVLVNQTYELNEKYFESDDKA